VFWADACDSAIAEVAEGTFGAMFAGFDQATEAGKIGDILKRIRNGQPLREFAPELAGSYRAFLA
jgi:CRISPR-associated protein Csd1